MASGGRHCRSDPSVPLSDVCSGYRARSAHAPDCGSRGFRAVSSTVAGSDLFIVRRDSPATLLSGRLLVIGRDGDNRTSDVCFMDFLSVFALYVL